MTRRQTSILCGIAGWATSVLHTAYKDGWTDITHPYIIGSLATVVVATVLVVMVFEWAEKDV